MKRDTPCHEPVTRTQEIFRVIRTKIGHDTVLGMELSPMSPEDIAMLYILLDKLKFEIMETYHKKLFVSASTKLGDMVSIEDIDER